MGLQKYEKVKAMRSTLKKVDPDLKNDASF